MSRLRKRVAIAEAKRVKNDRIAKRSLKRVADLEGLKNVSETELAYAIKNVMLEDVCYYGTIVEYAEAKGVELSELKRRSGIAGGEMEMLNLAVELFSQPEYEFAHDVFDKLVSDGLLQGQYDNDSQSYIEQQARNIDNYVGTDDISSAMNSAIDTAIEVTGEN